MTGMNALLHRETLTGTLVAETPLFVGAAAPGQGVDLAQARDGAEQPVIPATSLAGALRAARGETDKTNAQPWWGFVDQTGDGEASRVTLWDAPVKASGGASATVIRDNNSIDRRTYAAAQGHLFSREVLPAGTEFEFGIVIETWEDKGDRESEQWDKAHQWLCDLKTFLEESGLTVGGATTRGLGHLSFTAGQHRVEDFTGIKGLIAALSASDDSFETNPSGQVNPTDKGQKASRGHILITIPWRPLGAVMSKQADYGGVCNAFPLTVDTPDGVRLLLQGSSIKGALRSRAEYIARTVKGQSVADSFREQMTESVELPGVPALFGLATDHRRQGMGIKGALTCRDVMTANYIPKEAWEIVRVQGRIDQVGGAERRIPTAVKGSKHENEFKSRMPLSGSDADKKWDKKKRSVFLMAEAVEWLNEQIEQTGLWFDLVTRNAIDRWTGGVADGRLYTSLEPHVTSSDAGAKAWQSLVLDLDFDRLKRNVARLDVDESSQTALILLGLVLRDLADGWVPLGFGVTRGLGSINVDPRNIEVNIGPGVGKELVSWLEKGTQFPLRVTGGGEPK